MPTLEQLNEAVTSYMAEHPDTLITVVVDATFGHRIPKKEAKAYEEGIANNELVAPPAGAVGRGDAFVLGIADKANASVLSNDSFQEFHGDYPWLFDEGRLVGGKPVPHVGWVFVTRVPVRGPTSRKATRSSGRSSARSGTPRKASRAASAPMPMPKEPPPAAATKEQPEPATRSKVPKGPEPVNDLMPFLDFVEHHPVGTSVNGTVDAYSSHGAYVSIGDHGVRAYVPLRLMADPPPRSARKVLSLGESTTLVVVSFAAERRSIDCSFPDMADAAIAAAQAETDAAPADGATAPAEPSKSRSRRSGPKRPEAEQGNAGQVAQPAPEETAPAEPKRRRSRRPTQRKAEPASTEAAVEADSEAAPAEVSTEDSSTQEPTAKKTATGKGPAKKAPARKAPAKKTAAKKSTAKKTAAKKAPAKKTAAKRAPAKKTATKTTASQPSDSSSSTDED